MLRLLITITLSCLILGSVRSDCNVPRTQLAYSIDNTGWPEGNLWGFIFRYTVPDNGDSSYTDWTIDIQFDREVDSLDPYGGQVSYQSADGKTWRLTAVDYSTTLTPGYSATALAKAVNPPATYAQATVYLYNNGLNPDDCGSSVVTTPQTETTQKPATSKPSGSGTTTTASNSGNPVSCSSTASYNSAYYQPSGAKGILPSTSTQSTIDCSHSGGTYDYDELLYMTILFYQAQRSGRLDSSKNLVPWRGDSALYDGYGIRDLTGGWYDAGDFVKFGFPMASSATVLAWGMIEFEDGYRKAQQWDNALDMLKWATDYFLKAHSAPHELYFQVGDGYADHAYWGHPETMNMDRPAYKVDEGHPGSEVAGETAAALAAGYLVYKNSDPDYACQLLAHAKDLYEFAYNYRGNYGDTVPESNVNDFYKSWSGYDDELMWGAMWLYKATNDQKYLGYAEEFTSSVGLTEFSWDSKGPGAFVLLSEVKPEYTSTIVGGINDVMNKPKTPGGLTYFSEWGTNRYAANYALIALMSSKTLSIDDSLKTTYANYARDQIHCMLGSGDNGRSYVVGFGNNYPQQPHHRSSSCRAWTSDPWSQTCDYSDESNPGPNPEVLYGALVGGPGQDGSYVDTRSDYVKNEVACDYNAGFTSTVAGLRYFDLN